MSRALRLTHSTALILFAVSRGHRYGFDVMDVTGLASGTVYPVLRRLERRGLLRARWEEDEKATAQARPRRKLYELTESGLETVPAARRLLADAQRRLAEVVDVSEGPA